MKKGVYQIINPEGAIRKVDTTDPGKNTYGPVWAAICESMLNGRVLEANIKNYQYKTMNGRPLSSAPTGFIVRIEDEVDGFLPISLSARFRDFNTDYTGEKIAIMVESFDPNSLDIVLREIRVTDEYFDIEDINTALSLIGQANDNNKYVRGTIVGEKISYQSQKRAGYFIDINGLETFLPSQDSFFSAYKDIGGLIGHNVLASVKDICVEKMRIVLSVRSTYESLLSDLPKPRLNEKTKGIINLVDSSNINILLPHRTLGVIPTRLYPNKNITDWLSITGSLIECVPFREKIINTKDNDYQYLVGLC